METAKESIHSSIQWGQTYLRIMESCVYKVPTSEEYRLLQLCQYLSGESLKIIKSLGHSATAYQTAKERLQRKYSSKR